MLVGTEFKEGNACTTIAQLSTPRGGSTEISPSSIAPPLKFVSSLHGVQRGVMVLGMVALAHAAATCMQEMHNHVCHNIQGCWAVSPAKAGISLET